MARFAAEAETISWGTSKMKKILDLPLTAEDLFIQVILVSWIRIRFYRLLAESKNYWLQLVGRMSLPCLFKTKSTPPFLFLLTLSLSEMTRSISAVWWPWEPLLLESFRTKFLPISKQEGQMPKLSNRPYNVRPSERSFNRELMLLMKRLFPKLREFKNSSFWMLTSALMVANWLLLWRWRERSSTKSTKRRSILYICPMPSYDWWIGKYHKYQYDLFSR